MHTRRLGMADASTRIAIVNEDQCKPKKCRQECKKSCPVVKTWKLCIEVTPTSKGASIAELLCIGCGICVKKCPFEAIQINNLPKGLEKDTTHKHGANGFKLHSIKERVAEVARSEKSFSHGVDRHHCMCVDRHTST